MTNLQLFFNLIGMEKNIFKDDVYYTITWSPTYLCNRHTVMGIPGLPGIVCLFKEKQSVIKNLLLYGCWKSGVRVGLRNLLDPNYTPFPVLIQLSESKDLLFKYAVIDTHPLDMKDIMYWLIKEYQSPFAN